LFISRIGLARKCHDGSVVQILSRKNNFLVLACQPGLRRPVQKWVAAGVRRLEK
jgi:hypothetical protein